MGTRKKILLLVHRPQRRDDGLNWKGLRDLVRGKMPDVSVEISALNQLMFVIDGSKTRIYDTDQAYDISDFDLVVFRTLTGQAELAIAVAAYCRKKGVPYIDQYISTVGGSKISCAFVRYEHDLPVPPTAHGPIQGLADIANDFGWPVIVKPDNGKKGENNYLVQNADNLQQIVNKHSNISFVMQAYIPNNGDYRILVMNGSPRLAILRQPQAGSHLSNTSQGGTATVTPLQDVPSGILDISKKAAKIDKLAVAGVDVITDSKNGKSYILEVNRAPQLVTGAAVQDKLSCYADALRELLDNKYPGKD